jgi:hypothetical protein
MNLLWLIGFGSIFTAALLIAAVRRTKAVGPIADRDWVKSFSASKYKPMERLLCERDFEFIASHPGNHGSVIRKLRADRRRVFRAYLAAIIRDFNRLYAAATDAALFADQDRPELSSILVRQKLMFQAAIVMVHGRLILHTLGIGTVDARNLVEALGRLSQEARNLGVVEFPSSALNPL